MNPKRCKIIACETVIEEMLPLIPPKMKYEVLDFGLHIRPESLKISFKKRLRHLPKKLIVIILGYGLCSQAVVGFKADNCTLVIPRVDDCIAIFLGSAESYKDSIKKLRVPII